jgi:hypothetical protein
MLLRNPPQNPTLALLPFRHPVPRVWIEPSRSDIFAHRHPARVTHPLVRPGNGLASAGVVGDKGGEDGDGDIAEGAEGGLDLLEVEEGIVLGKNGKGGRNDAKGSRRGSEKVKRSIEVKKDSVSETRGRSTSSREKAGSLPACSSSCPSSSLRSSSHDVLQAVGVLPTLITKRFFLSSRPLEL